MGRFQLLSAKLKAPAPRKRFIPRPRLYQKLDRLLDHKVTVVQGSAGSGKTTLLTTYMRERPNLEWRWITLDETNNDVRSFWAYMIKALQDQLGQEPEQLEALFDALSQQPNVEHLLVLFVNRLEECGASGIIVLDDFHVLHHPLLLQSLTFFIKYSPDAIRLVLLTRETPALYLGELVMAGKYLEIGEQELVFSRAEADVFLSQTLGLTLTSSATDRLYAWSEGWVGGLQLSAIALGQRTQAWSGSTSALNKYMTDYLSNEILLSVSGREKQFMLQTSVLTYFHETICNCMLGINHAGDVIAQLVKKHLFVITVDEDEGIYRYHQAFGEFLRAKLREQGEDAVRSLHLKAAKAYEVLGSGEESLQHYLSAKAFEDAIRLLTAKEYRFHSWTYLRQIPLDVLSQCRPLLFQRLFYHVGNLEIEDIREIIRLTLPHRDDDGLWSLFQLYRFLLGDDIADLPTGLDWIDDLELLELDAVTRAIVLVTGATILSLKDHYATAMDWLGQAMRLERQAPNPYLRYFILSNQAQVLEAMGLLSDCLPLYEEMFRLCEQQPMLHSARVFTWIGLIGIQLKKMQLDQAEEAFTAIRPLLESGKHQLQSAYLYNKMELYALNGDREGAIALLHELDAYPLFQNPTYLASTLKYLLRYSLRNVERENAVLERVEGEHSASTARLEDHLVCARIWAARGEHLRALEHLDQLLPYARKYGIRTILVEGLLLKLTVLLTNSRLSGKGILHALREAIHYGYEHEHLAPFFLEAEKIRPYIGALIEDPDQELNSGEKRFAQRIQSMIESQASSCTSASRDTAGQETTVLSERELEVLQVLATGRTNKEIGAELCISLGTVKSHIINIYAKLEVSNRVSAVERGRELGLL